MVFENDDDFGIDVYRSDIWDSVASKNKITVGLIKFNDKKAETLQGDFLGVQSNVYSEEVFDIEVNLNSYSPQALKLKKQGFEARGELFFKCYAKYDVDISSKDMIVFFDEYTYGINAGYVFRVEMQDAGLYQGQYCWKEFDIILVRTDGWEYKSQANTIALNAVKASYDDLDEDDYTVATWEVMAAAYALPERTNPEVVAKIAAMDLAIDALVFHDLAALNALESQVADLTQSDYTSSTWATLVLAMALPETTNPLILTKISAINAAISALVFAGMPDLIIAEDAAADLTEADYTADSWLVLTNALALPETSNVLVLAKTSAINDAIAALVFAGMAALIVAENAAAALTESDWTPETWSILEDALTLPETTNAEVVTKTTAINNAISGLESPWTIVTESGQFTEGEMWHSGSYNYSDTEIHPNKTCQILYVTKHNACTATQCSISYLSRTSIIATANFVGNVATFSVPVDLITGSSYYVSFKNPDNSTFTCRYNYYTNGVEAVRDALTFNGYGILGTVRYDYIINVASITSQYQ